MPGIKVRPALQNLCRVCVKSVDNSLKNHVNAKIRELLLPVFKGIKLDLYLQDYFIH